MKPNQNWNFLKRSVSSAEKRQSWKKKTISFKNSGILCEGNRLVAYRFIQTNSNEFGLRWLLNRMGIHINAYYNYLKQTKASSLEKKADICKEIKDIYHEDLVDRILGWR